MYAKKKKKKKKKGLRLRCRNVAILVVALHVLPHQDIFPVLQVLFGFGVAKGVFGANAHRPQTLRPATLLCLYAVVVCYGNR